MKLHRSLFLSLGVALAASSLAAYRMEKLEDKKAEWWELSASYPQFLERSAFAGEVNKAIAGDVKKRYQSFFADAKREMPLLKKERVGGWYAYSDEATVLADQGGLKSVVFATYVYAAGAHGSMVYRTHNFVPGQAGLTRLTLRSLFLPGRDYASEVELGVAAQLLKDPERAQFIGDGMNGTPDVTMMSAWGVSPKGLHVYFGSYELGAYALGVFEVVVPYSDLPSLNPDGPLKPLLRQAS